MRVISFDVFDTLLTRTCAEPRDLFLRLGERLPAPLHINLAPSHFATARQQAEQTARRTTVGNEVSLDKIYHVLANQQGWDSSQQHIVQSLELALESESIRPVPLMSTVMARARQEADHIIFISDMYLPGILIESWLTRAGFWQPGDRLFVSGELGVSKSSGKLFEKIRDDLKVEPSQWSHHGDHPRSDYAQPIKWGLNATLQTAARLNAREQQLRGNEQFAPAWRSLLAGASRLARLDQPAETIGVEPDQALWATGTNVTGPLFYGFVDWCLAEASKQGMTDLFFLSRGGQIFWRIAQAIQAAHPSKVRLHYLPVSRLALAGIADLDDPTHLQQLVVQPNIPFHSFQQSCAHLGLVPNADLRPSWLAAHEEERNLTASERSKLADWLLDPIRLPQVQSALNQRLVLARAYFQQQGLGANSKIGLIDTGWTGTIQHHLQFVLGFDEPNRLSGFYLGFTPLRSRAGTGPAYGYASSLSHLPKQRIETQIVLIELMARADHGVVLGYRANALGQLAPDFDTANTANAAGIRYFQEAVLAFVRHALAAGPELTQAPTTALRRVIEDTFTAFYECPTSAETLAFGRLPHSDQMLEKSHSMLCASMGLVEVLTAMINHRQRPVCWWLGGQASLGHSYWLRSYYRLRKMKWWLQTAPKTEKP